MVEKHEHVFSTMRDRSKNNSGRIIEALLYTFSCMCTYIHVRGMCSEADRMCLGEMKYEIYGRDENEKFHKLLFPSSVPSHSEYSSFYSLNDGVAIAVSDCFFFLSLSLVLST